MFTLLEGEVDFSFRGTTQTISAGMTVNIPANAPHFFKNSKSGNARMLCLCSPSGQEEFFLAIGTPLASRTTKAPKPSASEQAEFIKKATALAPSFRTELLAP